MGRHVCDLTHRRPEIVQLSKIELQGVQGPRSGSVLARLGDVLEHLGVVLERPDSIVGCLGAVLGASWTVLEACRGRFGCVWGASSGVLGAPLARLVGVL